MTETQGAAMDRTGMLAAAMAGRCRETIRDSQKHNPRLPRSLHAGHLLWMCDQIERYAEEWSPTRLHRWLGFVQCALIANGMLDLHGAKEMFDKVKVAFGQDTEDLIDHLDPQSTFDLEIGGEG